MARTECSDDYDSSHHMCSDFELCHGQAFVPFYLTTDTWWNGTDTPAAVLVSIGVIRRFR